MKCFYHPQADAVGTCKHCSRGICHDCAAERSGGLACKNQHEAMVDRVSALIDRNVRVTSRGSSITVFAMIAFWAGAFVFAYLSWKEPSTTMKALLGVMTAWALVLAIANTRALLLRKIPRREAG